MEDHLNKSACVSGREFRLEHCRDSLRTEDLTCEIEDDKYLESSVLFRV